MKKTMFGEEAISKGYLQRDDLDKALVQQKANRTGDNQEQFIGVILIDMNFMTEKRQLIVGGIASGKRDEIRVQR